MTAQLAGARVLLTGATGGIGHAIARALHGRGAQLVLTGRRVDVLRPLAEEVGATSIEADLAKSSDVDRLLDECGPIDVLVANAALPGAGDLFELTEDQIDRVIAVNLRAPIVMARRLAPSMVERGAGHLVLIGSMSGLTASPFTSMYSATKFGLRGFALGLRQDLHGTGVGVSHILPSFVARRRDVRREWDAAPEGRPHGESGGRGQGGRQRHHQGPGRDRRRRRSSSVSAPYSGPWPRASRPPSSDGPVPPTSPGPTPASAERLVRPLISRRRRPDPRALAPARGARRRHRGSGRGRRGPPRRRALRRRPSPPGRPSPWCG